MQRLRAWLRTFGPMGMLDDCAALMLIEDGTEAEENLRRALEARPPLVQRNALGITLRAVRRRQAEIAADELSRPAVEEHDPPREALRRIA